MKLIPFSPSPTATPLPGGRQPRLGRDAAPALPPPPADVPAPAPLSLPHLHLLAPLNRGLPHPPTTGLPHPGLSHLTSAAAAAAAIPGVPPAGIPEGAGAVNAAFPDVTWVLPDAPVRGRRSAAALPVAGGGTRDVRIIIYFIHCIHRHAIFPSICEIPLLLIFRISDFFLG